MILDLKKTSYLLLLLVLAGLIVSPVDYRKQTTPKLLGNTSSTSFDSLEFNINELSLDQQLERPENLINNIIPTLIDIKNNTGSWNLPSIMSSGDVYLGQYGGLAGVGTELLNLHQLSYDGLTQENRDLALDLAIEIGYHMDSIANTNASGKFWPIILGSNITDYGFDFGLSGIASFFAHLFNMSQIQDFADISRETVNAINFGVNQTSGLHWSSQLIREVAFSDFYPSREARYYTLESYTANNTYFNGLGLGTLGITQGMLDVINHLGTVGLGDLEYQLLNSSLRWLETQLVEESTTISIPVASPDIGIFSTSKANGISGLIDVYVQLHDLTGNDTYLDAAEKGVNWLTESVNGVPRYQISTEINETLSFSITLGLSHGVAGTLDTLHLMNEYTTSLDLNSTIETMLFYLHNYGVESTSEYKYPERFSSGVADNLGSLSYRTGGGGILALVDELSDLLGLEQLSEDITKAKTYLYNSVINRNGLNLVPFIPTSQVEIVASSGFISSYHIILVSVEGQLDISSDELNFGTQEVGSSKSLSILLSNTGDEPILAQWGGITNTGVFHVSNFSKNLGPRSTFNLFISFIPLVEGTFTRVLTLSDQDGNDFTLDLNAQSFDLPSLQTVDVLSNNSIIDERENLALVVSATDSSGIENVKININGAESTMTTEVDSDHFTYIWNLATIQNGTYSIKFTALDTVGNSVSLTFVYTVGIYDPPLDEQIFSDTTLIILVVLIIVVVGVAVIVTRRITN